MKTIASYALTALLLAGCLLGAAPAALGQESIAWTEDFAQATELAKQQGRLLLLHFYSDDCPPCVRVERNVFSQPLVAQAIERSYVAVKVHAKKQPQLAQRYNVTQWPTDVIVSPAGQELFRTVSPQSAQDYVLFVSHVAAQAGAGLNQKSLLDTARLVAGNAAQGALAGVQTQAQALAPPGLPPPPGYPAFGQSGAAPAGAPAAVPPAGQPFFQPSPEALQQAVAQPQLATGQFMQQNPYVIPGQAAQPQPAFVPPAAAPPPPAAPAFALPAAATTGAPPQFSLPTAASAPASAPDAPQFAAPPAAARPPEAVPASLAPATAMEGYCPVTLRDSSKWVKGDRNFGAVHRGRTYLFVTAAEQQKFLADPDAYSPTLSGCDPVKFQQSGQMVDGKRSFGVKFGGKVYLFADLESRKIFETDPARFAETAYQATRQSDLTAPRLR